MRPTRQSSRPSSGTARNHGALDGYGAALSAWALAGGRASDDDAVLAAAAKVADDPGYRPALELVARWCEQTAADACAGWIRAADDVVPAALPLPKALAEWEPRLDQKKLSGSERALRSAVTSGTWSNELEAAFAAALAASDSTPLAARWAGGVPKSDGDGQSADADDSAEKPSDDAPTAGPSRLVKHRARKFTEALDKTARRWASLAEDWTEGNEPEFARALLDVLGSDGVTVVSLQDDMALWIEEAAARAGASFDDPRRLRWSSFWGGRTVEVDPAVLKALLEVLVAIRGELGGTGKWVWGRDFIRIPLGPKLPQEGEEPGAE